MTCLNKIRDALLRVSWNVGHFRAMKTSPPYIVWAEDSPGDKVVANGRTQNQAIAGTVDLFTRTLEGEPLAEAIPAALDEVCAWRLNSIQFEEDKGLLHYEWIWEVEKDG